MAKIDIIHKHNFKDDRAPFISASVMNNIENHIVSTEKRIDKVFRSSTPYKHGTPIFESVDANGNVKIAYLPVSSEGPTVNYSNASLNPDYVYISNKYWSIGTFDTPSQSTDIIFRPMEEEFTKDFVANEIDYITLYYWNNRLYPYSRFMGPGLMCDILASKPINPFYIDYSEVTTNRDSQGYYYRQNKLTLGFDEDVTIKIVKRFDIMCATELHPEILINPEDLPSSQEE